MIQIKAIMAFRTHYEEPAYSCLSLSVHRGWQGTSEPLSMVNKIIQEELSIKKIYKVWKRIGRRNRKVVLAFGDEVLFRKARAGPRG